MASWRCSTTSCGLAPKIGEFTKMRAWSHWWRVNKQSVRLVWSSNEVWRQLEKKRLLWWRDCNDEVDVVICRCVASDQAVVQDMSSFQVSLSEVCSRSLQFSGHDGSVFSCQKRKEVSRYDQAVGPTTLTFVSHPSAIVQLFPPMPWPSWLSIKTKYVRIAWTFLWSWREDRPKHLQNMSSRCDEGSFFQN